MGSVILMNGSDTITLSGNKAPRFPHVHGEEFFSFPMENPEYAITNRQYPITKFDWNISCLETNRDALWTYYDTTLSRGSSNISIMDFRRRFLFEAAWLFWTENWTAPRLFNVNIPFESSVGWTPPTFGVYPILGSMADHGKDTASDLSLVDGTIVTNAGDSSVLRENQGALKLGDSPTAKTGAQNTTLSWTQDKGNASITLFCQFFCASINDTTGTPILLMELSDTANEVSIHLRGDSATTNNVIIGEVKNSGTTLISKSDSSYILTTKEVWYDCAITFDDVNNVTSVYATASADSSFTNFLDSLTDTEDGIMQTSSSASIYPADTTWTKFTLLGHEGNDLQSPDKILLQNIMVIDDYVSPMQFNELRRLCYLWNKKTANTPN